MRLQVSVELEQGEDELPRGGTGETGGAGAAGGTVQTVCGRPSKFLEAL